MTAERAQAAETYADLVLFRVLGPVELEVDGQREALRGTKQRTVLAMLVAHAGASVSTERLIEAAWGDEPPSGARRSLQTYVSNLRAKLGSVITREGAGYRLDVSRAQIDAAAFEDELAAARGLVGSPELVADRLGEALAMWRGHPYDGVDVGTDLRAEVTRLNELRLVGLEARIDADLEAGRHDAVVGELEALTVQYPLREKFRGQHMLALFRCGRQAEALRAYQKIRRQLGDELGIDPSAELQELEHRILTQDPSLLAQTSDGVTRRGMPGYELRELIGDGSYGVVYRAYQPSVGREVAIKQIRPELANQPEFIRRFELEAQLIAQLEHPHIVSLYDYWRDPEGAYRLVDVDQRARPRPVTVARRPGRVARCRGGDRRRAFRFARCDEGAERDPQARRRRRADGPGRGRR